MTSVASKETVTPFRKGLKAVAAAVADDTASPVAPVILAVDPLIDYRCDAQRRRLDALSEIDLRTEQERLADELLAVRVKKLRDDCERTVDFLTQQRDAEHQQVELEIEKYRQIVVGTDAAIEATEPDADAALALYSGVSGETD